MSPPDMFIIAKSFSRDILVSTTYNNRFSAFREATYPVDETHSAGRVAMGGAGNAF